VARRQVPSPTRTFVGQADIQRRQVMKRSTMLIAALALVTCLLAAAPVAAQGYYRNYATPYSYGQAYVNPWTGGYGVNQYGYNPYTGTYGSNQSLYNPYLGQAYTGRSYYSPYTGRAGGYRSIYNPYTGQYSYQWYGN
jgi:hypothetical protein